MINWEDEWFDNLDIYYYNNRTVLYGYIYDYEDFDIMANTY